LPLYNGILTKGSKGIEEFLNNKGIIAGIYGELNHPRTITHTNGRYPNWYDFVYEFVIVIAELISN